MHLAANQRWAGGPNQAQACVSPTPCSEPALGRELQPNPNVRFAETSQPISVGPDDHAPVVIIAIIIIVGIVVVAVVVVMIMIIVAITIIVVTTIAIRKIAKIVKTFVAPMAGKWPGLVRSHSGSTRLAAHFISATSMASSVKAQRRAHVQQLRALARGRGVSGVGCRGH